MSRRGSLKWTVIVSVDGMVVVSYWSHCLILKGIRSNIRAPIRDPADFYNLNIKKIVHKDFLVAKTY